MVSFVSCFNSQLLGLPAKEGEFVARRRSFLQVMKGHVVRESNQFSRSVTFRSVSSNNCTAYPTFALDTGSELWCWSAASLWHVWCKSKMAFEESVRHKSGPLKQQNKTHKHGRHRSKSEIDKTNKGTESHLLYIFVNLLGSS